MKSSCTGCDLFWRLKVVVVFPVPDRPMISIVRSPASVGMTLQPACMARPPAAMTFAFHIRSPPFFDSPK